MRYHREGSPLALLKGDLYLLADRKARRWGRSDMQRLEDSRDTPVGERARRNKLENLRGSSLLFPGTLSSPVLQVPQEPSEQGNFYPCSPYLFL